MKPLSVIAGIFIFVLSFAFPPSAHAATFPAGLTQGEFALWLVKEAGAIRQLPTAASADDAIDFLRGLGVVPEQAWKKDEPVNEQFLRSFFDAEEAAGKNFDELVQMVSNLIENRFSTANPGVFRVQSASATTPV